MIAKNVYNIEWLESLKKYHKGNEDKCGKVDGQFTMQHTQVVQLLNSFMHYGANGDHFIMVFEILTKLLSSVFILQPNKSYILVFHY